MVKFRIKANPVGQFYFPTEIHEELGESLELIANAKTAVVFPEGTPLDIVLKSLDVIKSDLEHRLEMERRQMKHG